jgi:glycosyltransferase involved in cell wall biosynthesis
MAPVAPMNPRPKLLFIGPLPEPTTGHSLACKILLDDLQRTYDFEAVNLNKPTFREGIDSLGRVFSVLGNLLHIAKAQKSADLIYFTPSESVEGNLKDLAIYWLCRRKLSKMVIHLHGGASMRELMRGGESFVGRLNRPALSRLGGAIVLGKRLVDIFETLVPRDRIHVAANFAQDGLFLSDDQIRAKFALPGPVRLLFLSNLLAGKGHLELAEAFRRLPGPVRATLRLDFAGGFDTDENEAAFRARIADLPEIAYHGVVSGEAKRRLLAEAHVFCLPTYYAHEGQPISILEAYASGAVVITTDHSGIFDVFTDGENGFAVNKRSVAHLVERLRLVGTERGRLVEIGLRNAIKARSEFREGDFTTAVRRAIDQSVA